MLKAPSKLTPDSVLALKVQVGNEGWKAVRLSYPNLSFEVVDNLNKVVAYVPGNKLGFADRVGQISINSVTNLPPRSELSFYAHRWASCTSASRWQLLAPRQIED